MTVLLADACLELVDAVTFLALALTSAPQPTGSQWGVLAVLVAPRLLFAVLGGLVLRGYLASRDRALPVTVGYLTLVALQGAAGLFLLWGAGRGAAGRSLLALANVGALVAVSVAAGRRVRPAVRGVRVRR